MAAILEKLLNAINNAYLLNSLSFTLGVIITGIVTYFFSIRIEKNKLIKDMQINAIEKVLNEIEEIKNSLFDVQTLIDKVTFDVDNYNITYNYIESDDINKLSIYKAIIVEPITKKNLELNKCNIYDHSTELVEKQIIANKKFFSLIATIEAREIMFKKFIGIKNFLIDTYTDLASMESSIFHIVHSSIHDRLCFNEQISETDIINLRSKQDEFIKKKIDLIFYLSDFTTELQNEFLSKIFNTKSSVRVPKDKNLLVLRAGFKYECREFNYNNFGDPMK